MFSNSVRFIILNLFFVMAILYGQASYNHPELEWETFETAHFKIHFTQETERSAREGAFVAETIYPHVTGLYNYELKNKTHIIFLDTDDFSNGAAYYYDNKIEIWASPLDFDLRGSHRWLQNVITHEFTHIISLQKSFKFGKNIPGAYLQWIGYEDEKREDVLYGYPNVLVSYPIPGATVPPWLAEGVAQYMFEGTTFDFWDSNRDMILRDRALNDNLLTLTEMNTFGKSGIGNESTYNAGFAFVRYLASTYGEDVFQEIMSQLSRPLSTGINRVIKKVTGSSGKKVFHSFKNTLINHYEESTRHIAENEVKGKILMSEGTTNIHPVWSPDGKRFAYLSNKRNDYFSQTDLYVYDFEIGESEKIMGGVLSAPSWNITGDLIYYSKKSKPDRRGSKWYDIYSYSFEDENETRITEGARAFSPVVLNDSLLAYLAVKDGTHNIYLIHLNSEESEQITNFDDGKQLFNLFADSRNQRLLFDYVENHFRNTALLNLEDTTYSKLIATDEWDERDIVSVGENGYLYSTDKSGIYNLYRIDPGSEKQGYITNVIGGAFMPDVNRDGQIVYSLYENGGYKIALLDSLQFVDEGVVGYYPDHFQQYTALPAPITRQDTTASEQYEDDFSPMFLFPRVMLDYNSVKTGFYFFTNEILNTVTALGGASVNRFKDVDLFLLFELKKMYPTLFAEFFYITRHLSDNIQLYESYEFSTDVQYQLFASQGGFRVPFKEIHQIEFYGAYENYRSSSVFLSDFDDIWGKSGIDYLVGKHIGIKWNTTAYKRTVDYDINPNNGFNMEIDVKQENNRFYNVDSSYSENRIIFDEFTNYRVEGEAGINLELPLPSRVTLSGKLKGGWMSKTDADDFFNFFGGGLPGLKGYPFYSIEGNRMALSSLTLRLPLLRQKHIPLGQFILQNIVIGGVVQYGDAWNGSHDNFSGIRSVGALIRIGGFSFYNYPTGIGVEVHKGLDKFVTDQITYDGDIRTYFTLLFGFTE